MGDDHHAMGPGKIDGRSGQLYRVRSVSASTLFALLTVFSHAKPLYSWRAVSYPRQHQGLDRIPDPTTTDCLQPGNGSAAHRAIPNKRPDCWAGIRLLARHTGLTFSSKRRTNEKDQIGRASCRERGQTPVRPGS